MTRKKLRWKIAGALALGLAVTAVALPRQSVFAWRSYPLARDLAGGSPTGEWRLDAIENPASRSFHLEVQAPYPKVLARCETLMAAKGFARTPADFGACWSKTGEGTVCLASGGVTVQTTNRSQWTTISVFRDGVSWIGGMADRLGLIME